MTADDRSSSQPQDAGAERSSLPIGRYLSCQFAVSPDAGGQTRAMLMRTRILERNGGVQPDVLTFDAQPDYDARRALLVERGLLPETIGLLNVYDHYRAHGWGRDAQRPGVPLEDLASSRIGEEARPDGSPWRIAYRPRDLDRLVFDYLRPDGSPFMRIPDFSTTVRSTWRCRIQRITPSGEVVGEFNSVGAWFRRWLRDLVPPGERGFVFIDSRFLVPFVVPMKARRIHLLYAMHNIHLQPPRRWNSRMNRVHKRVLRRIDGMDAMVTLTERQRDDIAERRGRTTNMYVVPNPVEMPQAPAAPVERDPRLVTITARLTPQKRLTHAVAIFRNVVDAVPDAQLDIFGDGPRREELEREIERRGLSGSVHLRGFDPHARASLWRSSAYLLTSSFEGYPLATLESMSHGCPVVSYDIKYGPREQISDGGDGFLVAEGDVEAAAQRVIELLQSPERVREMSEAARRKAERFGPEACVANWARVLHTVVDERPLRTRLKRVDLALERVAIAGTGPLHRLAALGRDPTALSLRGVLTVEGRGRKAGLDALDIALDAVDDDTGEVAGLPLKVTRDANAFKIRARARLAELPGGGASDAVWLRLRLTWRNSAWQTEVVRPAALSRPAGRASRPAAGAR